MIDYRETKMSNQSGLCSKKLCSSLAFLIFVCLLVWLYADAGFTTSFWSVLSYSSEKTRKAVSLNYSFRNQQKIVLLWTDFFRTHWKYHFDYFGGDTLPGSDDQDRNLTCLMTTDRLRLNESDALIFHGRDVDFADLPATRFSKQRWVFYLMESPIYSGYDGTSWKQANRLQFNWTMTYNRKAQVWEPYWQILPQEPVPAKLRKLEANANRFVESFSNRTRDGLWFVSNCETPSRREHLVQQLALLGINFDSFGNCSHKNGDMEIERIGEKAFYSRYRFYMALENTICEDYATEKFMRALNVSLLYGLIPVAYGGANYSAIAPPGSTVEVASFKSVAELADHLKSLKDSSQKGTVSKYFEWHKTHKLSDEPYHRYGFENLCKRLFIEDSSCNGDRYSSYDETDVVDICNYQKPVRDIRSFLGTCHSPKLFPSS